MREFIFYAEASVGCACILALLLYSIKRLPTPQLNFKLFYKVVLGHILYFTSDAVWALVNADVIPKNAISVLAVNYSNAVILAFLFYNCFVFAEMSTRPEMNRAQIRKFQTWLRIPVFVESFLLLVSFTVMPGFWLDKNQDPRDIYYFVLMFLPALYILWVTARCLFRGFKSENRKHLKTYLVATSYTLGCIVAAILQIFYTETTPIFCFWCTLIILFIYLVLQNLIVSTDALTSLNNRNQLQRFLQTPREQKEYYVVMVDVNHFKNINDTYGHLEGDRALILISKALRYACSCLGKSVFLCRYGGDEFMLVVATVMPGAVVRIIRECLKEEISNSVKPFVYPLDVSIGYAAWDGRLANFRKSVNNADLMMYEDKRSN